MTTYTCRQCGADADGVLFVGDAWVCSDECGQLYQGVRQEQASRELRRFAQEKGREQ